MRREDNNTDEDKNLLINHHNNDINDNQRSNMVDRIMVKRRSNSSMEKIRTGRRDSARSAPTSRNTSPMGGGGDRISTISLVEDQSSQSSLCTNTSSNEDADDRSVLSGSGTNVATQKMRQRLGSFSSTRDLLSNKTDTLAETPRSVSRSSLNKSARIHKKDLYDQFHKMEVRETELATTVNRLAENQEKLQGLMVEHISVMKKQQDATNVRAVLPDIDYEDDERSCCTCLLNRQNGCFLF
jgi:hypothetical protein